MSKKPICSPDRHILLIMTVILLLLSFVLGITILPLATEGNDNIEEEPKLAGFLITREYLDLFDMESFLQDHVPDLMNGGEYIIDEDVSAYQGRLYATYKEKLLTDAETGEISSTWEYEFDEVDGISFICYTMVFEDGSVANMSSGDNAVEGNLFFRQTDEEDSIELAATLYIAADSDAFHEYYVNPVYQSSDGRVFAVPGSGFYTNAYPGEVERFEGHTFSWEGSQTISGKPHKTSVTIDLSISTIYAPQSIVLLQMDENNQPITRQEYLPGQIPETLTPEQNTSYILVETHKKDETGTPFISREMFQPGDDYLYSFFCREDAVCEKKYTQLLWHR